MWCGGTGCRATQTGTPGLDPGSHLTSLSWCLFIRGKNPTCPRRFRVLELLCKRACLQTLMKMMGFTCHRPTEGWGLGPLEE